MQFTAADILRAATRNAPPIKQLPELERELVAAFNERLPEVVLEAAQQDPERLMASYTVPSAVVASDPIDLTDDGTGTGAREWFLIGYIDAYDSGGDLIDEVWIATIEARNRAKQDYQVYEAPVGYLRNQLRDLVKLDSFDEVDTLTVFGILAPDSVAYEDMASTQYNYPSAIRQLLVWECVTTLAPLVEGITAAQVQTWENRRRQAWGRMIEDAGAALSRIEELPVQVEV